MSDLSEPVDWEKCEVILREIVNFESWENISRKEARRELERRLKYPEDSLRSSRSKVNELLDSLIDDLLEKEHLSQNSQSTSNGSPTKKVKQNDSSPPRNLKKLQAKILSKSSFLENAQGLSIQMGPKLQFYMNPRKFGPGSCGWYYGGKAKLPVGDKEIWCQLNINCIALGSREWDEDQK
ncbi:hypothetical protein IE077_002867 [Cardiosporidium cionae]|uniref:DEK C-terminal domain-containing protein n=1 Tax=Cardiosporidium cionae TaxID=476202 RepID=A0ABQ7J9U1_9APIC|nr:hypothetical protein IE077_002867 [Cardiosporidium cionae]|eukprot:KAF8820729.1 hypothetical protein IE077_002867 [Cardiosporidium cionae]